MADRVQKQEQLGLHHWSRCGEFVHLLGSWHGRRILQYVERAPAQRVKCILCQDLGEHVVRVCEIAGEECGKNGPKPFVHGLTHVSNDDLIALGHGRVRGVHEHVLRCLLHIRGPL